MNNDLRAALITKFGRIDTAAASLGCTPEALYTIIRKNRIPSGRLLKLFVFKLGLLETARIFGLEE